MKIVEQTPTKLILQTKSFKEVIAEAVSFLGRAILAIGGLVWVSQSLGTDFLDIAGNPFLGIFLLLGLIIPFSGIDEILNNREVSWIFDKTLGKVFLKKRSLLGSEVTEYDWEAIAAVELQEFHQLQGNEEAENKDEEKADPTRWEIGKYRLCLIFKEDEDLLLQERDISDEAREELANLVEAIRPFFNSSEESVQKIAVDSLIFSTESEVWMFDGRLRKVKALRDGKLIEEHSIDEVFVRRLPATDSEGKEIWKDKLVLRSLEALAMFPEINLPSYRGQPTLYYIGEFLNRVQNPHLHSEEILILACDPDYSVLRDPVQFVDKIDYYSQFCLVYKNQGKIIIHESFTAEIIEKSLPEIADIEVEEVAIAPESSSDTACRIILLLKSGDRLELTHYIIGESSQSYLQEKLNRIREFLALPSNP